MQVQVQVQVHLYMASTACGLPSTSTSQVATSVFGSHECAPSLDRTVKARRRRHAGTLAHTQARTHENIGRTSVARI